MRGVQILWSAEGARVVHGRGPGWKLSKKYAEYVKMIVLLSKINFSTVGGRGPGPTVETPGDGPYPANSKTPGGNAYGIFHIELSLSNAPAEPGIVELKVIKLLTNLLVESVEISHKIQ